MAKIHPNYRVYQHPSILETQEPPPRIGIQTVGPQNIFSQNSEAGRSSCREASSVRQRQDMNIGKFGPLPLFMLIGNFRTHLHIVSLVAFLRNWVCNDWVDQFPRKSCPGTLCVGSSKAKLEMPQAKVLGGPWWCDRAKPCVFYPRQDGGSEPSKLQPKTDTKRRKQIKNH